MQFLVCAWFMERFYLCLIYLICLFFCCVRPYPQEITTIRIKLTTYVHRNMQTGQGNSKPVLQKYEETCGNSSIFYNTESILTTTNDTICIWTAEFNLFCSEVIYAAKVYKQIYNCSRLTLVQYLLVLQAGIFRWKSGAGILRKQPQPIGNCS